MKHKMLSSKLLSSTPHERRVLLENHLERCNSRLAVRFQEICYEIWTSEPYKVSLIVEILRQIQQLKNDAEIQPYVEWMEAIENLVNGDLKNSLLRLDTSESYFKALGRSLEAAKTQPSKVYVLALLGRYEEAVDCGQQAREVFVREGDIYSAGKIEHNLGNLFWRRDLYAESEPYLSSAHQRFEQIDDQRQLAMVENCQAFVKALQNDFDEAEDIYARAIKRTEEHELTVTQAEIEIGLSNLYLFQGRLDLALSYMEKARQKYEVMQMPIQTANCELEIADIYLELNLLPEALMFFKKVESTFSHRGMKAELSRSLIGRAKASYLLGEDRESLKFVKSAQEICESEGNAISNASIKLLEARVLLRMGDLESARTEASGALEQFQQGGNLRQELIATWVCGEIAARQGDVEGAETRFSKALERSREQSRHVKYLCLVSLGKLKKNEQYLNDAIEEVEDARSRLQSADFRTSFFSDKLAPYDELTRLKISESKYEEAFVWHERSRSRSLFEGIRTSASDTTQNAKLQSIQKELNWCYNRINRRSKNELSARDGVSALKQQADRLEAEYSEFTRRIDVDAGSSAEKFGQFDLRSVQEKLEGSAIVEFVKLGSELSVFVLTENEFRFFETRADYEVVRKKITQLLFQIKTARLGTRIPEELLEISYRRMLLHSQRLYDLLLRPVRELLGNRALKIVPSDALYYLPFQVLHDGERFLIEKHEMSYAPSTAIFDSLTAREPISFENALMIGVTDDATPFIKEEVQSLCKVFEVCGTLVDEKATVANIRASLEEADVIHFACHGKFRQDSPEFSSLSLFSENLTVKEVQGLNLQNKFVALSACETGLNNILPGEELAGLTSGFMSAGATSLLLSLWAVNDYSTQCLMKEFYVSAAAGAEPGEALKEAQIEALRRNKHPYFWAPFNLVGR